MIDFMERFAGPVKRGSKRQTVRREHKTPIEAGDPLRLYTNRRVVGEKGTILQEVICKSVEPIRIEMTERGQGLITVSLGELNDDGARYFAQLDGFENFGEFFTFFARQYDLPFEGVIIKW